MKGPGAGAGNLSLLLPGCYFLSLNDRRRAIYHLLDNRNPADGMAAYYAYYHDDGRTRLRPFR
jgi:hypothetical protein